MGLITLSPDIPWLSLVWLSLLAPSVLLIFIPNSQPQLMRIVGTGFAFVSLVLSLLVFLGYNPAVGGFQFVERLDWIPQLGISYLLGVDGISLAMLVLNGVVIFTGALMSWNIERRTKEYWVLLLLLTTGVYGVFVSLDMFLFFVFYELA
ncbi:MAG: NADH-quinone oxidoreductase subunit M, partial [Oscillochloris sp.]|nr:NADH-quinone oxidoreductase subunit M [Oscillochloris sp.]